MVFILDSPKRHNLKVNGYCIFDTYDIDVYNGERKKRGKVCGEEGGVSDDDRDREKKGLSMQSWN